MIVYGDVFSHAVIWITEKKVVGIFPSERAAELFIRMARADAPTERFEVITLDEYEKCYFGPIDGRPFSSG